MFKTPRKRTGTFEPPNPENHGRRNTSRGCNNWPFSYFHGSCSCFFFEPLELLSPFAYYNMLFGAILKPIPKTHPCMVYVPTFRKTKSAKCRYIYQSHGWYEIVLSHWSDAMCQGLRCHSPVSASSSRWLPSRRQLPRGRKGDKSCCGGDCFHTCLAEMGLQKKYGSQKLSVSCSLPYFLNQTHIIFHCVNLL